MVDLAMSLSCTKGKGKRGSYGDEMSFLVAVSRIFHIGFLDSSKYPFKVEPQDGAVPVRRLAGGDWEIG
jgi:hypothetical protein